MIVTDTNVIAYLLLPGDQTEAARAALARDAAWAAPLLWRSEFRSVLRSYIQQRHLSLARACEIQELAEELMWAREFPVESADVLKIASASGLSTYDSEFVSLAHALGVKLVTSDKSVLAHYPSDAISLKAFAASGLGE